MNLMLSALSDRFTQRDSRQIAELPCPSLWYSSLIQPSCDVVDYDNDYNKIIYKLVKQISNMIRLRALRVSIYK